ncbi:ROK family transcriptional regulator [Mariniphaga sp.]|uniref:ROK family transcriptional regulator n=1 Tax=Mariniphaga sp. TaxID=1954475 RepID=UPI003566150D
MILNGDIKKDELSGNMLKKYQQKKKILNLLYKHETLSGPIISKRIGVSLPTAISLLNELTDLKYIEQRGTGESRGGRKPTLFGLSNNSIFIIACEIERYRAKIIIYNSNNQAVTPLVKFETSIDDDQLVDKIHQHAKHLIKDNKIDEKRILGVGITMPGLIDEVQGMNFTIKNKAYQNVKKRLEDKFGKLVYVNNDARMQAYGEYIFGAAKGHKNAIVVTWSYGVGLGIIIDGKLYNGASGFAGELSHIQLVEDGNLCICGKRGCLETVASAYVLVREAKIGIKENRISQLTGQFTNHPEDLKPEDVISAARAGDEFSIHLLHQVGLALGKGLSVTLQLLNPDIIVLGGPISAANQFVLTSIQQSLNKYCLEQIYSNTKIVVSEIWEQSGLLGVTAMLYQKLFSDLHS